MSFGRPGGGWDGFKVTPPDRGSFPLDHDGDCKATMMGYLKCLKLNGSNNGPCRLEAKEYLQCRMDHGLMIKDDMANLGLGDVGQGHAGAGIPVQTPEAMATTSSGMGSANASTTTTTTSTGTSTTDQFPERI